MLDALLMPTWEYRYFSFDAAWPRGCSLASMQNGSGDFYHILFTPRGTLIKGYGHESLMAQSVVEFGRPWPGVLEEVPAELAAFLQDPALTPEETTFCL